MYEQIMANVILTLSRTDTFYFFVVVIFKYENELSVIQFWSFT